MTTIPKSINKIVIYNCSHVTTELPEAFYITIKKILPKNIDISIESNIRYDSYNILYILICPMGIINMCSYPIYYITYQLEPTNVVAGNEKYRKILMGALINFDYSKRNVDYCKSLPYINSVYLPIGYTDNMAREDISNGSYCYNDDERSIDVLFLGWDIHPRRKLIKQKLEEVGIKSLFIINQNLQQMKEIIRKSKICLNMRATDEIKCLETIRLNILLSNQSCVINENVEDYESNIYDPYIISVSYENIVNTCKTVLDDFEKRKEMAIKSFNWYITERKFEDVSDIGQYFSEL